MLPVLVAILDHVGFGLWVRPLAVFFGMVPDICLESNFPSSATRQSLQPA